MDDKKNAISNRHVVLYDERHKTSISRQTMQANQLIEQDSDKQLITKVIDMPAGYIDEDHTHCWHQIIFPLTGLLQSGIGSEAVIVPHNALLYVPAYTVHRSVAVTETKFLALYLNPKKYVQYSQFPRTCLVTPFIKELILLFFSTDVLPDSEEVITHLLLVLRDQIAMAKNYHIPLLIPQDKRLLAIFTQLTRCPDSNMTLKEWAGNVGASERTLSRLLAKEFAYSFSLWRQHIRLVLSLKLLTSTMPIHQIAMALGYASDSAYIHAFKKLFGKTPNQYRRDSTSYNLRLAS